MTDKELDDIATNSDSLVANLSHISEFPEEEEYHRTPAADEPYEKQLYEKHNNRGQRFEVGSALGVEDLDQNGTIRAPSAGNVEFVKRKHDFFQRAVQSEHSSEKRLPRRFDGALLQCWDLGGQGQYMMAHALFVGFGSVFLYLTLRSCVGWRRERRPAASSDKRSLSLDAAGLRFIRDSGSGATYRCRDSQSILWRLRSGLGYIAIGPQKRA